MIGCSKSWRRAAARLLTGLAAPALLSVAGVGRCAEPPAVIVAAPAIAPLADLDSFRATALERQPSIAAARASLAAALSRSQSLNNLPFGSALLARDLPVRKQQAGLGIQSYQAGLCVAEAETRYAVTYFYIANLYAQQQQDVLLNSKKDLDELHRLVKGFIDNEQHKKFISREHMNLVNSYVETLEGRRQETLQGAERALAALREAIGVGADCGEIRLAPARMPMACLHASTTRDEVVALALARRGEVLQAATFAQVTCLEISAQGRTFLPSLRTFASGSDIHAITVPSSVHGMEYRPGALAPEMPIMLSGSRSGRIDQASSYLARAEAVAEKTRNLVTLEAEDAFFRWQEARIKAEHLKKAAVDAEKYGRFMIQRYRDAAEGGFRVADPTREPAATRIEEVLLAGATSVRMRIDANRAYFEYLLTLASLERVTVGGFHVEFCPAPEPVPTTGK